VRHRPQESPQVLHCLGDPASSYIPENPVDQVSECGSETGQTASPIHSSGEGRGSRSQARILPIYVHAQLLGCSETDSDPATRPDVPQGTKPDSVPDLAKPERAFFRSLFEPQKLGYTIRQKFSNEINGNIGHPARGHSGQDLVKRDFR